MTFKNVCVSNGIKFGGVENRQQLEPLDGVNNCGIATHPQLRTMLARGDRAAGESDRGDILDAAALQDGLTRRMKLNLRSQQPRVVAIVKSGGTSHETQVARRRQRGERATPPGEERNGSCVHSNSGVYSGDDCGGHYLYEYREPQRRVCLTLSQLRGLEEPPQPTLSRSEWSAVEAEASARGDGDEVALCPICREAFRGEREVLLSCSHVFHKSCLASFERFSRTHQERNQERCCPLCRKMDYQKKATALGAVAWRQYCARRLQCAYRGHKARRAFRHLLRGHYAAGLGDRERRRVFLSGQAADGARRLAAALEDRGDSIDRLFAEFDRGLAFSRQVFGPRPSSPGVHASPCNDGRNSPGTSRSVDDKEPGCCYPDFSSVGGPESKPDEHKWKEACRRAMDRGEADCPICICPMEAIHIAREANARTLCALEEGAVSHVHESRGESSAEGYAAEHTTIHHPDGYRLLGGPLDRLTPSREGMYSQGGGTGSMQGRTSVNREIGTLTTPGDKHRRQRAAGARERTSKATLLLSCSHVFHKACLEALESFDISEVRLCPVCRQEYDAAIDPSVASGCLLLQRKHPSLL
ncbi:unnamed protein product [Ascophyllum nodosum]